MAVNFGTDPRLARLHEADTALTARGSAFEVALEDVLGERMAVFARRARTVADVLHDGAANFGDRDLYIWSDGRRSTFAGIIPEVAAIAAGLHERYGIRKGDRVAICAANSPEYLHLFWACAALGAVLVAMNGWWTDNEMRNALDLTRPSLLVMDEKRHARLERDPGLMTITIERDWAMVGEPDVVALPHVEIAEDDPFELIFTSGTTGRPKAAVLSHRSVVSYLMLQSYSGARSAYLAGVTRSAAAPPTRLAVFPMFHVSGLSNAVGCVMTGASSVWPLGRFDAAQVIELTTTEGINVWGGGTPHVVRLLEHPDVATVDATQILSVGVGGSATPPAVIDLIEQTFPHLTGTASSGYGSTETGLLSQAPNWMLRAAPDAVGPPLPTVSIRITDDSGEEVPAGVAGHIEARSWQSMIGYWENPDADSQTIRPGRWIRTGDYGRLDEGVLRLSSRLRDLIIRGGENIYPFEIEHRLEEHPDVVEAAAFGIDDATYGQVVKAIVVVRDSAVADVDALRSFCASAVASYKVPEVLEIRTEPLPRTASGKVMKHVLAGAENTQIEE